MSHHWKSISSKLTSETDPFIFTPRGCCRITPSSDGRGRQTNGCDPLRWKYHEWMLSSSCEIVFESGWEQRGEGRNFANHWQNTHPTNLKPKRPPQTKIQSQPVCSQVSSCRYCFASHACLFVFQTVSCRQRQQFFTVLFKTWAWHLEGFVTIIKGQVKGCSFSL